MTPPTAPSGLTASPVSPTVVALAWSGSTDDVGVTGYEIVQQGNVVGTTTGTAWGHTGLAPLSTHCWEVRARDAEGNRSPGSGDACATTLAPPDVTPPAIVETLPADGAGGLAPTVTFTERSDEAVAPASLASGFVLLDAGGTVVPATVAWDAGTLAATLTPASALEHLGRYTAVVSTAVTDAAGIHLAAERRWSLRVAAKQPVLASAAGGPLTGVTTGPPWMAFADFDADGHLDVALSELGTNVWIAMGDGAPVPYPAGRDRSQLAGLAAADLDGDGDQDLAGVERLDRQLTVFLGDGHGGFGSGVLHPVADPVNLVAVPLRAGGPIDLVPSVGPVLLGDGQGGFTVSAGAHAPSPCPMDVAAADLDGDGHVDLVEASCGGDFVTVLHGDGAGGFPTGGTLQTGAYPLGVEVVDLNGDGRPDLIVTLRQNGGIGTDGTVLLLGLGGGEYAPPAFLGLGTQPLAAASRVRHHGAAPKQVRRAIPGPKRPCLEGGAQSAWPYELLQGEAGDAVVTMPAKWPGRRTTRGMRQPWRRAAPELPTGLDKALQLRGWDLRPAVVAPVEPLVQSLRQAAAGGGAGDDAGQEGSAVTGAARPAVSPGPPPPAPAAPRAAPAGAAGRA